MTSVLLALAFLFTELSLLAFGGGQTILPEMQRQTVEVQHWLTAEQFADLFALAQSAPGPNMMIVPLIGWRVAGLAGVLVASIAKFGPSSLITGLAFHVWERFPDHSFRLKIQAGLVPLTAGLITASALVIARSSVVSWRLGVVAGAAAILATLTRIHPLLLLATGAAFGLTGFG